jgi:hypothetical protein
MVESTITRPAFLIACAANAAFAALSAFVFTNYQPWVGALGVIGGGLAFIAATALGILLLRDHRTGERPWIKAALAFLALSPFAFGALLWPASADAAGGTTLGDFWQTQAITVSVALAALVCAAKAMTMALGELAD